MAEIDPATELLIERLLTQWTDKIFARLDEREREMFGRLRVLEDAKANLDGRRQVSVVLVTVACAASTGITTIALFLIRKFLHV